jgi:hypothetical protein
MGRVLRIKVIRAFASARFVLPLILGFAVGVFWGNVVWWHKDNSIKTWLDAVPRVQELLFCPASWLWHGCQHLGVRPGNDPAGNELYAWCVVGEWTLLGLAFGLRALWESRYGKRLD